MQQSHQLTSKSIESDQMLSDSLKSAIEALHLMEANGEQIAAKKSQRKVAGSWSW